MLQPNRNFDSQEYRYGFNGKEKDDEVKGQGVQYDYGFRIYDARLGKFLSEDPLTSSYPHYTPYQFAGNKPVIADDLDGLEERIRIFYETASEPVIDVASDNEYGLGKGTLDLFFAPNVTKIKTIIEDGDMNRYRAVFYNFEIYYSHFDINNYESRASGKFYTEKKNVHFLRPIDRSFWQTIWYGEYGTPGDSKDVAIELAASELALGTLLKSYKILFKTKLSYKFNVKHTPINNGKWSGERGNSTWYSTSDEVLEITKGEGIPYKNGQADFSKWKVSEFDIPGLQGTSSDTGKILNKMKEIYGFKTQKEAQTFLKENNLTPHHSGGETIQLVPTTLNNIPHTGGASQLRNQ